MYLIAIGGSEDSASSEDDNGTNNIESKIFVQMWRETSNVMLWFQLFWQLSVIAVSTCSDCSSLLVNPQVLLSSSVGLLSFYEILAYMATSGGHFSWPSGMGSLWS